MWIVNSIIQAIKFVIKVVITVVVGFVTLVFVIGFGVVGLGLDILWWAWSFSLGHIWTNFLSHPSIDDSLFPVATQMIDWATTPLRKLWHYFWDDD
jgi:hypothetical protein